MYCFICDSCRDHSDPCVVCNKSICVSCKLHVFRCPYCRTIYGLKEFSDGFNSSRNESINTFPRWFIFYLVIVNPTITYLIYVVLYYIIVLLCNLLSFPHYIITKIIEFSCREIFK